VAEFFYGTDLYNDLFLNNNREMYVKILLLDYNEPEITSFYILDEDITESSPGVFKASRIFTFYDANIKDGDSLLFNALDTDVAQGCTVSWSTQPGSSYIYATNDFAVFSGEAGSQFLKLPGPAYDFGGRADYAGFSIYAPYVNNGNGSRIVWLSNDTVKLEDPVTTTFSNYTESILATGLYVSFLNVSNFYTSNLNSFEPQNTMLESKSAKYYECNNFNNIIFANKQIQGTITNGSLRADGNSPMRRTIDFSCIVDRVFGEDTDLKIHDFDNKKIKILIGIKDLTETTYSYKSYFSDNGTLKDENDIVWFKMGVYVPKNISIKHSVDSYQISITAQDKLATLDGSFGGLLGTGRSFKNGETNQNFSFYDTIKKAFDDFTNEKVDEANYYKPKLSIKLADDFEIKKYPPYFQDGLVYLQGPTLFVENADNLYIGMNISGPGIYDGTAIRDIETGPLGATITMTNPAYSTLANNTTIFANEQRVKIGVTFSEPSFKNFFAVAPLESTDSYALTTFKKSTINFKNYSRTYDIYTTIANWEPQTWGSVGTSLSKPILSNPLGIEPFKITGYNSIFLTFTTDSEVFTGDLLNIYYTSPNPDLEIVNNSGLFEYKGAGIFRVGLVNQNGFELYDIDSGEKIIPKTTVSNIAEGIISSYVVYSDIVKPIERWFPSGAQSSNFYAAYNEKYNKIISLQGTQTNIYPTTSFNFGIRFYNGESFEKESEYSFIYTLAAPEPNPAGPYYYIATYKDHIYTVNIYRNAICGYTYGTVPRYITITGRQSTGNVFNASNADIQKLYVGQKMIFQDNIAPKLGLDKSFVYIVTSKNAVNNTFTLKRADNNQPVIFNTAITDTLRMEVAEAIVLNTYNISGLNMTKNGKLVVFGPDITTYSINELTGELSFIYSTNNAKKAPSVSRGTFTCALDEDNNIFGFRYLGVGTFPALNKYSTESYPYSIEEGELNKYSGDGLDLLASKKLSTILEEADIAIDSTKKLSFIPFLSGIFSDNKSNIYLAFTGSIQYAGEEYQAMESCLMLDSNLNFIRKIDISLLDGNNGGYNFTVKDFFISATYYSYGMISRLHDSLFISKINALREFAPASDNTIEKTGEDSVFSILEDVKDQLGPIQYYYDTDGKFIMKRDNRLIFSDPNLEKTNPYDFSYDGYNINVSGVPFIYDFVKNNTLLIDYNNTVDLSAFKNDFFINGIKKGIESSSSSSNIDILYHVIIDDLSIKDLPTDYYHPWQQYIVDKGNAGTSYSKYIYYKELKQNFEFKNTRLYVADSDYKYVAGEFILTNNTLSGIPSSSAYSIYEVTTSGSPTNDKYPTLKDGAPESLVEGSVAGKSLTVKFHCNAIGPDYQKIQGIYSKIHDDMNLTNFVVRKGEYVKKYAQDGSWYIYQVEDLYYYATDGQTKVSFDTPILFPVGAISPPGGLAINFAPKYYTQQFTNGVNGAVLSCSANTCFMVLKPVDVFRDGFRGLFRSNNSGVYSSDFVYDPSKKYGDPGSWSYFYDVIYLPGKLDSTNPYAKKPAGITDWQAGVMYEKGDKVLSDNKIYEAIIYGLSATRPTGFGDSENLIRETAVPNSRLTWKLVQISIDFSKMKVSAIGSRKAAIFDDNINTLFAPLDALAYYYKDGYYFIVLSDFYDFDSYSAEFHTKLEKLIRQFQYLYPNIKLIITTESYIADNFQLNKLTTLKDAFSVVKRTIYLNFVNGQSVAISTVPIYTMEPLGIVRVGDESADIFGNFILTDFSLPLSNEGALSATLVKTHPYDDKLTYLSETVFAGSFNTLKFNNGTYR